MSAVERAKDLVINRIIANEDESDGVGLDDLYDAIDAEYRENEIFPKTDYLEDWLKLIDFDPEDVMDVRPVREGDRHSPMESIV